ncbi:MAG: DUF4910 domain-containing protein [Thermocrispum sp.]
MTPVAPLRGLLEEAGIGEAIFALAAEIYPICRSITGDGVRTTLDRLARHIDLEVHEVPTGTQVFDWTIPREWNIRDAWIKNAAGQRVVDFRRCNLHVLNYSRPVHAGLPLDELKKHVFTLPEQPDLIPYRTSYYTDNWGFCMAHDQLAALPDGIYEVLIDASLEDGSLTYGEYLHRGETDEEFLFSAHVCHPSLANDNCSGLALLTHLAERLAPLRTRYSYRFLFAPGTIGAIAWLARNEHRVAGIRHGLVVSCVGDGGGPTYKKSRQGNASIDRAMTHVLRHAGMSSTVLDFFPYGYDERQYCSPGFNLPVGSLTRTSYAAYPEYHTSADNPEFVRPDALADTLEVLREVAGVLDRNRRYRSLNPYGEPQLGKRGLYDSLGGRSDAKAAQLAMLWVLNLADGEHTLLDVAERAGLPFDSVHAAAQALREAALVKD